MDQPPRMITLDAPAAFPRLLVSALCRKLTRPAFFEGYRRTSLRGLIHFLCSHDQQHLAGLQWLLGKLQVR
jgi:hypothetical protein